MPSTWSKHILWGNHLLSGGVIDPKANAWRLGVEWGWAKTQGPSDGDNIVWGTAAATGTTSSGARRTATTSSGAPPSDGDNIVWGTAADGDNIVWGTDCGGDDCDNVVWGTADGDNIVWGTAAGRRQHRLGHRADGDNIVWGTYGDGDNIVWGTTLRHVTGTGTSGADLQRGQVALWKRCPTATNFDAGCPSCSHDPKRSSPATGSRACRRCTAARWCCANSAPSDAASLFALLTTEEVSRFISPPPSTVEGFERFIGWTLRQRAAGTYACFAVTVAGFDTAIGIFQVRRLEPGFGTAEWGFAIGSDFWGTGVFQEGAKLVLDFAFETIGVHRLEARAAVRNGRGNSALQKMGAVQECRLRNSFLKNGEYHDQVLYSLLDTDWRGSRSPITASPVRVH